MQDHPFGRGHMRRLLLSMALLAGLSAVAFGQTAPTSEIAPGGKLRVGMIAITVLGGVAEPVARDRSSARPSNP
jgi:polar amino acid transport system substrate-binding protein